MQEIWHSVSYQGRGSGPDGPVWAEACIDPSSQWFSGHFPNAPILPGVALLAMVGDIVRRHASEMGKQVQIAGIKRVRFRLPVRPGDVLTISLTLPDRGDRLDWHFKVAVNGETSCTGMMNVVLL
ncbi:MAG: MaoC/PaaZ C-terminal domain-containing protein [Syntrophales bacterium]|nr:MaoC/PaaZ C-terminal domain-containing protein [Syntrophales bacterium]